MFSPKDKIGDWLEMYTKVMELNYWHSTECKSASFDETTKEWTVNCVRDGKPVTLRPKQLVLATGMSAMPNIPKLPGAETFKGEQHHSSQHPGPRRVQRQKVRRHRLEQFGARHLRGTMGGRCRCDDGPAVIDAYRQV